MNAGGRPRSVLVTGAFGNVGESTVLTLLASGHHVVGYDLPSPRNRLRAPLWRRRGIEVVWGDVTDAAPSPPRSVGSTPWPTSLRSSPLQATATPR